MFPRSSLIESTNGTFDWFMSVNWWAIKTTEGVSDFHDWLQMHVCHSHIWVHNNRVESVNLNPPRNCQHSSSRSSLKLHTLRKNGPFVSSCQLQSLEYRNCQEKAAQARDVSDALFICGWMVLTSLSSNEYHSCFKSDSETVLECEFGASKQFHGKE